MKNHFPVFFYVTDRDRAFGNAFSTGTKCEIRPWSMYWEEDHIQVARGLWDELLYRFKEWDAAKADYIQIDNGYFLKSPGSFDGYFRFSINSIQTNWVMDAPIDRLNMFISKGLKIHPWKIRPTGDILICLPGKQAARYYNFDPTEWSNRVIQKLRDLEVKNNIVVRGKPEHSSNFNTLYKDLDNAYCVITHTSMVAVDAILYGIPVIVDAASCAAPVARINIESINDLYYGPRTKWLKSLSMFQFSINEMSSGYAWNQTLKNLEYYKKNVK